MNLRQLFFVHNLNDSLAGKINTVLFAGTFFVGRIMFQVLFIYKSTPAMIDGMKKVTGYPTYEVIGSYLFVIAQFLGLFLNLHWGFLIGKGLIRIFTKKKDKRPKKD